MEGLKTRIYSSILNRGGASRDWLRQYRAWQHLPAHSCSDIQLQLLADLVKFAATEVPYYRNLLAESGILGEGRVQLDCWPAIPLLDKEILRHRFSELAAPSKRGKRIYANTSGGSTGNPVRFLQDREYAVRKQAIKYLFNEWSGHGFGGRQVKLWGSTRDLFVGGETVRVRLGRWLRQELWLNAFRMTPAQMRDYVRRINDFRPVQILAYVDSVYQLARFIRREGCGSIPRRV